MHTMEQVMRAGFQFQTLYSSNDDYSRNSVSSCVVCVVVIF